MEVEAPQRADASRGHGLYEVGAASFQTPILGSLFHLDMIKVCYSTTETILRSQVEDVTEIFKGLSGSPGAPRFAIFVPRSSATPTTSSMSTKPTLLRGDSDRGSKNVVSQLQCDIPG
jgi:hypothetical protein